MTEINITAEDTAGMVHQIQQVIGGRIQEKWGESSLQVSGALANGSIRLITFDWGVSLLDFKITFYDEITLIMNTSNHQPLHFVYCLEGSCRHKFDHQPIGDIKTLEQYQSVILTGRDEGRSFWYFPKEVRLEINVIQIIRRKFLKKRLNGVEQLNNRLYQVFHDLDHENRYAFYGAYDLQIAEKVDTLLNVNDNSMMGIMKIEGLVYQILSGHIADHDKVLKRKNTPTGLLRSELRTVRKLAKEIVKDPAKKYRLDELSIKTGLSQAKLQEGFKLLFTRTVTEYIRHVRLELARDYLRETDMNISQVVYSVGFSSRSYFSKIFKEKFGMSPSEFKKKAANLTQPLA